MNANQTHEALPASSSQENNPQHFQGLKLFGGYPRTPIRARLTSSLLPALPPPKQLSQPSKLRSLPKKNN